MSRFESLADACAERLGIEHELYGESRLKRSVQWDADTLKSLETSREAGVGLRVLKDGKLGFSYANESEAEASDLVQRARSTLSMVPSDEHHVLPNLENRSSTVRDWLDETVESSPEPRIEEITEAIEEVLDTPQVSTLQVSYTESATSGEIYRDGSPGGREDSTRFALGVWAICGEDEETRTGYGHQTANFYADLDARSLLETSIQRGLRQLGSSPPESHRGALILTAHAASRLMNLAVQMLDGEALVKGRSAWDLDRIGEQVASPAVSLVDDPTLRRGGACRTYDGEGQPMSSITLVEEGVLQTVLTNTYVARRAGLANTKRASRSYSSRPGVGSTNCFVEPGASTRRELADRLGCGPVVTDIQPGSGMDPVAGHFSVGAKGYFLEKGEPADSFHEGTLSGSFEAYLKNISGIGRERPRGYPVSCPALLVDDMTLGGSER